MDPDQSGVSQASTTPMAPGACLWMTTEKVHIVPMLCACSQITVSTTFCVIAVCLSR
ncbi:hypothetical protein DPMN_108668 [Dreissena polymorpha]|uniref:Uncharacterized protein n=1 Tax=Dreissena polymorpha TaxID=45954 RepID=A0A9D4QL60_DREPO|nr:hypothetical protein DPMN_108591 [Dreissena polymorpha]KAH3835317.1 hypothetical protein DPMN_108668 [Dreissena polymorpha]